MHLAVYLNRLRFTKVLFDFTFFEINVLTDNWVIFLFDHFLSHCPRVLFRDVKIACISCTVKADFNCCWLRHGAVPLC